MSRRYYKYNLLATFKRKLNVTEKIHHSLGYFYGDYGIGQVTGLDNNAPLRAFLRIYFQSINLIS